MPTRLPSRRRAARGLVIAAGLTVTAATASGATTLQVPGLRLAGHGDVDRHTLRRVANRAASDLAVVADFLGAGDSLAAIQITVYRSLEAKGLATGYTLPVHAFTAGRDVHVALEPGFEGELSVELARMALRDRLGRPRVEALETGLAAVLAGDWRGRDPLYWAGRLAVLDDLHDVGRLADDRWLHRQSDLVMTPVAAALVSFLVSRWGKPEFLARYPTWAPSPQEAESLRTPFGDYLRELRRRHRAGERRVDMPPFQRGFCHAHEGYQIHNGYASAASDSALAKLSSLGANAVSITPFTYMRATNRPAALPFSSGAGSENDESIIHAVLAAHELGMAVMLKPHVWMRGSWPGEIAMTSEADWDAFFGHYYRWIRHYALMAEMYDVEVLCIGVELSKTSVAQAGRWRDLVKKLRSIYRGRLTYAANWGEEFESTPIWDVLDYAAVNCYYPLSDSVDATDADLLAGAEAALDRVESVGERWDRPVIVAEVGFASAPAPWIRPYRRQRGAEPDPTAQARCYEAFFRALLGRSRCAGVYWWKWPSFLEYGGVRHSGFTPNNKPAERIVERWYGDILSD